MGETFAGPDHLMSKIYLSPTLRHPEVSPHMPQLVKLLKQLCEVQQAADRTRGKESPDSERFYVQMFDYLHNLVRLKLITRSTGEAWEFFLDLRGRFSFITSDKQWSGFRDRVLGGVA